MADRRFPNALQMRDLKYGKGSDAERDRVAAELREVGRRTEALLLFEGRPEAPFLQEEKAWAVAEGIGFHLIQLGRQGVAIEEADYRGCAEAAEAAGRWLEARACYVALEDEAAIERIAEHLPPSLRPEPKPEAEA